MVAFFDGISFFPVGFRFYMYQRTADERYDLVAITGIFQFF